MLLPTEEHINAWKISPQMDIEMQAQSIDCDKEITMIGAQSN